MSPVAHGESKAPRIIVALDYADPQQALGLVQRLSPRHCRLKIGKELFTRAGPALVEGVQRAGFDVFLDLKFHDIPHTVARACAAAADLGVWMVNVHALGGRRMLEAAREALERAGAPRPLLIAVTVLTSATEEDLAEVGLLPGAAADHVRRLAALTADCGLDGVVCSARETALLRRAHGEGFLLVTPGIRPAGAGTDDQRRTATPVEAVRDGSDFLVIGRPVTQAPDPLRALVDIEAQIAFR